MDGFGGLHRLHELSDSEKMYKKLVNGIYGHECEIEDVELKHEAGCHPKLSCKVSMPYHSDDASDSMTYYYFGRGNGKSRRSFRNYMEYLNRKYPRIEKVHFSGPVTAVIWSDGTKTIVRCDKEDFDHEKGLAMAIAKKFLGTNESGSNYYDVFKKWLPEEKVKTEVTSEGITFTFNGDDIRKSIDRAFKIPPYTFFGRSE